MAIGARQNSGADSAHSVQKSESPVRSPVRSFETPRSSSESVGLLLRRSPVGVRTPCRSPGFLTGRGVRRSPSESGDFYGICQAQGSQPPGEAPGEVPGGALIISICFAISGSLRCVLSSGVTMVPGPPGIFAWGPPWCAHHGGNTVSETAILGGGAPGKFYIIRPLRTHLRLSEFIAKQIKIKAPKCVKCTYKLTIFL